MRPGHRFYRSAFWGALASIPLLVLLTGPELRADRKHSASPRCFALPHAVDAEDTDVRTRHRLRGRHFDVYETSALELDVHCFGGSLPELPELRVRLFLPNGDVYETLDTVAVEPTVTRGRRLRRIPVATARLPVAGSFITQLGLVGAWSARVCWEEASCGRPLSFSLER